MSGNHVGNTTDYLSGTQVVLSAGRQIRAFLDADPATLEYAVTRLERAAQEYEGRGSDYRAFMFSELDSTDEAEREIRQRLTEDVLATVLTDFEVANVMIAAGQTMGETGEKAEKRFLDDALLRLDITTRALERSLPSPLTVGTVPGRFGFAEAVIPPQEIKSPDLMSAIQTFKRSSDETLTRLVSEAQGVGTSVVTSLSKLPEEKVLAALSKLGEQVQELPMIGRLFRQGVTKLLRAIDSLIRFLGKGALNLIKVKIEQIWQKIKDGQYLADVLNWAFEVEPTRSKIDEILNSKGLDPAVLDEASNALGRLSITFEEKMKMAEGLAKALTLAGTLLALTPLSGAALTILVASTYGLILAAVVLIGMDYADSGRILQRVRGVREIADDLLS